VPLAIAAAISVSSGDWLPSSAIRSIRLEASMPDCQNVVVARCVAPTSGE